jgi:hypothetical protein
MNRWVWALAVGVAGVSWVTSGVCAPETDRPASGSQEEQAEPRDVKNEAPRLAFCESGFGMSAPAVGVAAFGTGRGAADRSAQEPQLTGGLQLFGSPFSRLTLIGFAERVYGGSWRPTATAVVRVVGGLPQGWALGALARYKAEGFAEIEGEIELGALFAWVRDGWHLDLNAIVGTGFEESETDAEGKLRVGYDLAEWMRVGMDGQVRYRLTGDRMLPGGRTWDAIAGPQLLGGWRGVYAALTAGPSTVDIASKVGWSAILTTGGIAL